jgi:hypothetical protein
LDSSENILEIRGKVLGIVLEKDGEEQLERPCEI